MRRFLDTLYAGALWLSAFCLVMIALLVGAQLAGRIVDGALKLIGVPIYGFVILSLAEIAGFLLAAASFFALAGTLKAGAHIRVTMLLGSVPVSMRKGFELFALGAGALFSAYVTWNLTQFAYYSWKFNEVSNGLVPVKLAIPQAAMAAGAALLTVALIDEFIIALRSGKPSFTTAEDAISLSKEG